MPIAARACLALLALVLLGVPACQRPLEAPTLPRTQTWAELRAVRRGVSVTPPGEAPRAPYARERLVDGERVTIAPGGLGWLRRDGGATLLVRGPARLVFRASTVEITEGRVFIDAPDAATTVLDTPSGALRLAHVRASLDVRPSGETEAYVLAGEIRTGGAGRASAGERLRFAGPSATPEIATLPALAWEDWTGGLATADRAATPGPFGLGTVGARTPGQQGTPRFALSIQKLDVQVTLDHDFAVTEVDETFFNPTPDVVEGPGPGKRHARDEPRARATRSGPGLGAASRRGHPAHRAAELRAVPRLLRERPTGESRPPCANAT